MVANFFGGFEVRRDGKLVEGFTYTKLKALFAYLTIEPAFPFNRDILAGLFWPEQSEAKARHSLRQALSQLRSLLEWDGDPPLLLADRMYIQRNPLAVLDCDVQRFTSLLNKAGQVKQAEFECLEKAIGIYRGEMLKGLSLAHTELFEEWLTSRRESFHQQTVWALERLVAHYERRMDYYQVRRVAEKWVSLEPWREEAQRALMSALARTGQRTAALKQYRLCCEHLTQEFGLLPDAETEALHRRIRAAGSARTVLPIQANPFIGRRVEMGRLLQLLADPQVRLVTILGPGGTGKTRLSLQLGSRISASGSRSFLNGVAFVPLEGLNSPEALPAAIAQALSYRFRKGSNPTEQIIQHLREMEMLLILDNLEHLQGFETTALVQMLLDEVKDLKILVTSRQRLSLHSENLLELGGLTTPGLRRRKAILPVKDTPPSSAVRLFLSILKRMGRDGELSQADMTSIVRICQLVEGMPLAIEMAAAQASSLSIPEIALSLEESLHLLKAEFHDLPSRHRSIHAAIDASWRLLEDEERSTFRRLSLFRSGFTFQVAQEVSCASKVVMSRLVNKSFVRYQHGTGRYKIHELLRQYGAEKLAARPGELLEVRKQHGTYYSGYAVSRYASFYSRRELDALYEIEAELPNINAAWVWALEDWLAELVQLASVLYQYYLRRARFQEGIESFQVAVKRLDGAQREDQQISLAWMRAYLGHLHALIGNFNSGMELLEASLALASRVTGKAEGAGQVRAFCLSRMGMLALEEANSQAYLEESLRLYRELGDHAQEAIILAYLGDLLRTQGKLDQATSALSGSLAIQQELGSNLDSARTLTILSLYAMRRGDLEGIAPPLKEAAEIARKAGDQDQLAFILESSGIGYGYLGRFEEAVEFLQECMEIRAEIDQHNKLLICNYLMGMVKVHQGKIKEARSYAQKSLQLGEQLVDSSSSGTSLLVLGTAALVEGFYQEAHLYLQKSIAAFTTGWQEDWRSRQGLAYAILGILDCCQDSIAPARDHTRKALVQVQETQSYIGLLHCFPAASLLLAKTGRIELALEIFALAETQPLIMNSAVFQKMVGHEIRHATRLLDPQKAQAIRQSGKARDLWQTANEMIEDLAKVRSH
jgi:predicted ATPase/DNA-binding SARP family transcriptional activator